MENDLGRDKISRLVVRIAVPSMLAQFVSVLYSIVDRMYVGNIPGTGELSLAGVGVCGPVVTLIGSLAFWIGIGGTPLMGISMGEGRNDHASRIVANCFLMLCVLALAAPAVVLPIREPMLRLFGASDVTYPYAEAYFTTYLTGTAFALLSTGMNQFIIAQGYARVGMVSVMIGAVMNIALDPLFIFVFGMGVRGAALATVVSQGSSAAFVMWFLLRRATVRISFGGYSARIMLRVIRLGATSFVIISLDNVMIIAMNALLQLHGGAQGDMLITVNTIVQSFMLVMTMPLGGISGGTQSILSFNYGARRSDRVIAAQKAIMALCALYTGLLFVLARTAAPAFASLFTQDALINAQACRAIRICTLAAVPLGIQYAIVDGFIGMGLVRYSLPLSMWRKGIYFISIFLLPLFFDASAVFYAETISDVLGPVVSVTVYVLVIRKVLHKREMQPDQSAV